MLTTEMIQAIWREAHGGKDPCGANVKVRIDMGYGGTFDVAEAKMVGGELVLVAKGTPDIEAAMNQAHPEWVQQSTVQ